MLFLSRLRTLRRMSPPSRAGRTSLSSRTQRPPLYLEPLENRWLPSTVTWTGAAGNDDWDTPGNWSTGGMPGASDDVVINQSGITISHSAGIADAVNSLTSQANISISGGSLSLAATSTITAGLSISGGTLTGDGDVTVDGTFTWTGGTLSGSGSLTAAGGASLSDGDLTLDGRTLDIPAGSTATQVNYLAAGDGAVINNAGTWELAGDYGTIVGSGIGAPLTFNNSGSLVRGGSDPGAGAELAAVLNNTGSVVVQAGQLGIDGFGQVCVSTGSFTGEPGTTLTLVGQITTLEQGLSGDNVIFGFFGSYTVAGPYRANTTAIETAVAFTGPVGDSQGNAGGWDIGGAGADFSPAAGGPVTLTFSSLSLGSQLSGIDSFVVSGPFTWTGGTLAGPQGGSLTAAGGMTLSDGDLTLDGRTLDIPAGSTATQVNYLAAGDGAVINNAGTWELAGDYGTIVGSGIGAPLTFNNSGSLVRGGSDPGAGAELAAVLNNTGSVVVQTGQLGIDGFGQVCVSTGSFTGEPGTTLTLVGQITTLEQGLSGDNVIFGFFGSYTVAGPYRANTTVIETAVAFTGTVTSLGADVTINEGTLDLSQASLPGPVTVTNLTLQGGTLNAPTSVTVSGAFNVSGDTGYVLGGGTLYLDGTYGISSSLQAAGTVVFRVAAGLDNGDDSNPTPSSLRAAIDASNQTSSAAGPNQIAFDIPWNDPSHVYYRGQVSLSDVTPVPANTSSDADLANASQVGSGNTIAAAWPHSWWDIQLQAGFAVTVPVVINGYTQSGASPNTLAQGDNAVLRIVVNGSQIPVRWLNTYFYGAAGIGFGVSDSTVTGIVFNGFDTPDPTSGFPSGTRGAHGAAVVFNAYGAQNDVFAGNFFGTDISGTLAVANWTAIWLYQGAQNNRVGSNGPQDYADRNIISGNSFGGVLLFGAGITENNSIAGNLIGTDRNDNPLGNGAIGVGILWGALNNQVGGNGGGNVIACNGGNASYWGSEVGGPGVLIADANSTQYDYGGLVGPNPTAGNSIEGNAIYGNAGLGIDLASSFFDETGALTGTVFSLVNTSTWLGEAANDSQGHAGPDDWQNFPVLTSASASGTATSIAGTYSEAAEPNTTITLDFYANPAPDPSCYGQGHTYLGSRQVTTDANGNATFSVDLQVGNLANEWLSATATGPYGSTSEFSTNLPILAPNETFAQFLQTVLPQSSTTANSLTIPVSASAMPATVIQAVNGLTNVTQPVTIILDLGGGTYSSGGVAANPPPNVTFVIRHGTLDPPYPALTVAGGQVTILDCTLTTSGDAPTLLVTGGSVMLRNDTIQESTGYSDAAIAVTGGTVDLGTAASPGGNTLNITGTGVFVHNTTSTPLAAVGATFTVNGVPLTPSSLSGLVFQDFNDDGQVDFREQGLFGVTITLTGTDDLGNTVHLSQQTDRNGVYYFGNLRPGSYYLTETQPAGYLQGIDSIGTAGGSLSAIDQFFVQLGANIDGMNYNYGERPPAGGSVQPGQTAGIGFWHNSKGQALIKALNGGSNSTQLAHWLATTLPSMYGAQAGSHSLVHSDGSYFSNAEVAAFYLTLFNQTGPKLDAQVLATALSVYVTNATLDPTLVAAHYGFTVSGDGVGTATINVGSNGDAFGVASNSTLTVMDLLLATDAQAVDGVLYNGNPTRRNEAKSVYSAVNQAGGI